MPPSLDPYTYPGTEVLRNLLDIREPARLAAFEANETAARLIELSVKPTTGGFDAPHLRAIHRHIFQDVYAWAGSFRTVNIAKGGHLFAAAAFIESALEEVAAKLRREGYLQGLQATAFAVRSGYYLAEMNAIHPFRDGNGRAQRELVRELAAERGFSIDWRRVTRGEMIAASLESFQTGNSMAMAALIVAAMR